MTTFWAVLATLAVALLYLLACRIWPYGDCWRCGGNGKFRSPSGKAWRKCRRCKGSGVRLRIGTQLINRKRDTRDRIQ